MRQYATGLYGRTSKDDRKRVTIEIQQARLIRWAESDEQVARVVDGYWDEGVSGKVPFDQRPNGRRLLDDVRSGHIQSVAVLYCDRFGRTLLDGLQTARMLEQMGVKLIAVEDGWDARRDDSPLNFQLRLMLAEEEHRRISARMQAGKARAAKRDNAPPGGPLTFGYRMDERGHYVIDPIEATVVVRLFEMALADVSHLDMLAFLNSTSCLPGRKFQKRSPGAPVTIAARHTNARWHLTRITKILRNPVYTGRRRWGAHEYPCPVIIDHETFAQVQVIMDGKARRYGQKTTPDVCLCSSMFKCGTCGRVFYHCPRRSSGPGRKPKTYQTYICDGMRRGVNCRAKIVRADELDAEVWRVVYGFLQHPEDVIRGSIATNESIRRTVEEYDQAARNLVEELDQVDAQVRGVWDIQRQHNLPLSWVGETLAALNAERESIIARQKELAQSKAASLVDAEQASSVVGFLAAIRAKLSPDMPASDKHRLIRMLVAGGTINTLGEGRHKRAEVVLQMRWGTFASGKVPKHWSKGSHPDVTFPLSICLP